MIEDIQAAIEKNLPLEVGKALQKRLAELEKTEKSHKDLVVRHKEQSDDLEAKNKAIDRMMAEAIISFKKVLKLDPDRAGAHYRLGVLYDKTGALDSAITSFKKAIKLEPNRADFYYTLGIAQDKNGEQKKAIDSLNKAIELAPDVDKYHYRLGLIYDGQSEHEKAVEAFKKASEAEDA